MSSAEPLPPEEPEFDLRTYLQLLRRRWRVIVVTSAVVVTAALVLSLRQSPLYRAESELLIYPNDGSQVISGAAVANGTEATRRLNNDVRLFESEVVESAVAAVYDGPLNPSSVQAWVSSSTADVVKAAVVAADPEAGAELVNVYVDVFLQVRRAQRTDELLKIGDEIQARVNTIDQRISDIKAVLVPVSPGGLDGDLADEVETLERQRAFYQSQIEDLQLSADIAQSGGAQVLRTAKASGSPVSPTPERDGALAAVIGLMLGVALAFAVETLDERIRSSSDLERVSGGLHTLALVPAGDNKGWTGAFVSARDDPHGPQAEAFRSLRTAVKFAALDEPLKVIQITSPELGEGKSTTVANLAVALAQGGDRVVVVCCDLRRPSVHERFGVPLTPGLTDVLVGDATLAEALHRSEDSLLILSAGTLQRNPSELLSTHRAAAVVRTLAEEFDFVVLDTTPVLPVTDALVVSRMADATVVVADSRSTSRKAVRRSIQLLNQVNAPVVGLVLNGLPAGGNYEFDYGYGDPASDRSRRRRRQAAKPEDVLIP